MTWHTVKSVIVLCDKFGPTETPALPTLFTEFPFKVDITVARESSVVVGILAGASVQTWLAFTRINVILTVFSLVSRVTLAPVNNTQNHGYKTFNMLCMINGDVASI